MSQDKIVEISIDRNGRLCIKPRTEKFTLIYRSATQVHWDDNRNFLYSPKPREWTYLDWYKQIVSVISTEYNCKLTVDDNTKWFEIPRDLKNEILNFETKENDGYRILGNFPPFIRIFTNVLLIVLAILVLMTLLFWLLAIASGHNIPTKTTNSIYLTLTILIVFVLATIIFKRRIGNSNKNDNKVT